MSEDSQIERFTANVRGRVQGVSFRYATLRRSQLLNVTGWVRNEIDGSVTVVAQGDRIQLDKLLRFLHKGPPSAIVDNVEVVWSEPKHDLNSFIILWT